MRPRRTSMKRPAPPFPSDPTIRSRLASVPATPHQQSCPMRTTLPWSVTSHAGIATLSCTPGTGPSVYPCPTRRCDRPTSSFSVNIDRPQAARLVCCSALTGFQSAFSCEAWPRSPASGGATVVAGARVARHGIAVLRRITFFSRRRVSSCRRVSCLKHFFHRRVAALHRIVLHGAPGRMAS